MWWLVIPIGAYAVKKIYEIATEDDSSSSSSTCDDEYERAKREDQKKIIKLMKKDLADQYSEDMRSFFAEHSDVLSGTVPKDLSFKKVNSLLNEFSANVDWENFLQLVKISCAIPLQFVKKIAPDAHYGGVETLWDVFSTESPVDPANFLQFIRKIAPDADYTKDFKQLDTNIQQLDTEIKQLRNLKNELLQSLEENL